MEKHPDTICARLTPPGRGAVAVVGLQGKNAESIVDMHFRPADGNSFCRTRNRRIVYGIWQPTGEDLVVSRRGDQAFEVHCHGGNSACSAILSSLADSNVRQVSPAELIRAFENPWTVSTQLALTQATTARTAKLLLHQLGILPESIRKIGELTRTDQVHAAIEQLERMLGWSDFGIQLTKPRSVVLCGQPNVGKSSLANAMIGFQRAIVHDVAGTTRDVVSQLTAIDGWPVELKDTAGLRQATDTIEAIGIEKARTEIELASLSICVFDHSQAWTRQDQDLLESIVPDLVVFNKTDLASMYSSHPDRPGGMQTSVKTGRGIEHMIDCVGRLLVPELPAPGQAYPVTEAQRLKLADFLDRLRSPQQVDPKEISELLVDIE